LPDLPPQLNGFTGMSRTPITRGMIRRLTGRERLGYATWFAIAIAAGLILVIIMLWPMVDWLR
jgi:hypothetical protein